MLAESDYFDRLDLDSPLDIRFRADVTGKSILFVGYSLGDVNLRYFLYRLSQLWRAVPGGAPKSYLVVPQSNPVQTKVLQARQVETVVADAPTLARGLIDVLKVLSREVSRRRQTRLSAKEALATRNRRAGAKVARD